MLYRLRQRSKDEGGFTLIAIPSFLNQKTKANDAQAKELVRTAQTTAETIATDNGGSYETIKTKADINAVEKSVPTAEVNGGAYLSAALGEAKGYSLTATAGKASGNTYTIESKEGVVTRTCTKPGTGGCPSSGEW
jgi:Tfp pilus assembly protein PilE